MQEQIRRLINICYKVRNLIQFEYKAQAREFYSRPLFVFGSEDEEDYLEVLDREIGVW